MHTAISRRRRLFASKCRYSFYAWRQSTLLKGKTHGMAAIDLFVFTTNAKVGMIQNSDQLLTDQAKLRAKSFEKVIKGVDARVSLIY